MEQAFEFRVEDEEGNVTRFFGTDAKEQSDRFVQDAPGVSFKVSFRKITTVEL